MTLYVANVSGGLASAVAAERLLAVHPDALLWFADTRWEDEDLYRYLADLERHWGRTITRYADGRTPLEVAEKERIIPNHRIAPCSRKLKAEPGETFLEGLEKPVTFYLGFDWTDMGRVEKYQARYAGRTDIQVDFPLLWKPIEFRPYADVVRSWGIEPPRLYQFGFHHNNCGGRCVRQGVSEWRRLLTHFPERFAQMEAWEERQRAQGGARASHTICREQVNGDYRPITLAEIRRRYEGQILDSPSLIEDRNECFCQI